jgi:hypothetical protein
MKILIRNGDEIEFKRSQYRGQPQGLPRPYTPFVEATLVIAPVRLKRRSEVIYFSEHL